MVKHVQTKGRKPYHQLSENRGIEERLSTVGKSVTDWTHWLVYTDSGDFYQVITVSDNPEEAIALAILRLNVTANQASVYKFENAYPGFIEEIELS